MTGKIQEANKAGKRKYLLRREADQVFSRDSESITADLFKGNILEGGHIALGGRAFIEDVFAVFHAGLFLRGIGKVVLDAAVGGPRHSSKSASLVSRIIRSSLDF